MNLRESRYLYFNKDMVGTGSGKELEFSLLKYDDLPRLAKWKALITEYGVDFEDPQLFLKYKDINSFKVKYRISKPITENLKVYDVSTDTTIIPSEITIHFGEDTSIVKLGYRPNSPIQVDIDKNNKIYLKEKTSQDIIPIEVRLVKKMGYQSDQVPAEIDSRQPKLADYIDIVGLDRLSVVTFDGCWNWNLGTPCQFCDLHPRRKDYLSARPSINTLSEFGGDINLWWKYHRDKYLKGLEYTFRYLLKNENIFPHKHLLIMSGMLPTSSKVWDIAIDTINTLNKVEDIGNLDNYLNVCPHPNLEYLNEVKRLGVKQVQYNLEVVGSDIFKSMCPGKLNYSVFKSKLEEAVGVMGFGKVRCNFVLGIQPVEQLLVGIKKFAERGVVADYSIFQPKRSTPLVNYLPPSMEIIVGFTKELVKIYKKYGFKGIYCGLSSRSSIINECLCTKNFKDN